MAAAFAAGLLAGCSSQPNSSPVTASITASNVTLTAAQRQNLQLYTVVASQFHKTVDTTGTVDFDNDQASTILAPMSGPVARLLVSLGQQVAAEQTLAEVDSPDFATAVSAYRKTLATAKITRQLAEMDQQLVEHHGITLREAEQAKIDAANAEADSEAALQELVSLKVAPETIKDLQAGKPIARVPGLIRSPLAGTVVERLVRPGELLEVGATPCFTVADLSRVWVMAHLFGADLGSVSIGDTAEVLTGTASEHFSGTVGNISALVDPDTRSVAVRVVVENPGGLLKRQTYVHVLIHASKETAGLLVPVSGILRNEENLPFVYVAQPDSSFGRQRVTLGYREGDRYEITAGLKAGDRVVVDGGLFVQFLQNQ
ncbi:MAG TPA: efflux RND transporter periplasmic adaptor subunit [Dongiaceae bacterium]|nr:efflux RND transporter periplasmic adaptor subunit [Dongiaceae bacterium]